MSRKEEILRRAEELRRQELARPKADEPYDGSRMDAERMPLGCWIWVLTAIAAAVYGIFRLI